MNLTERINALAALGHLIEKFISNPNVSIINNAYNQNPWFTEKNQLLALQSIRPWLTNQALTNWVKPYNFNTNIPVKNVGLIMAGNLPLAGFHDLLCTLVAGHRAIIKSSSKDDVWPKELAKWLVDIAPGFEHLICFDSNFKSIDALIAAGTDNTAKHLEQYFKAKPKLIRKNRTSVAIITEHTTNDEIEKLGDDIFAYFGLGCRNVSYLLFPEGYQHTKIYPPLEKYKDISQLNKYMNNYSYNRAIYLLEQIRFFDNGFLMLRQSESLFSPTSVLHYGFYKNQADIDSFLTLHSQKIQATIGQNYLPFGSAQQPKLTDWADNINTLKFLEGITV